MRSAKFLTRRLRLRTVLGLGAAGLLAAAVGVEAQTGAGDFIPRATIIEIMDSMVMSTADVLWNATGVSVTEAGIVENKPETEEDWARLRWAAVTMAEATNSLLIPGRHVVPAGTPVPEPDPADPSLAPDEVEALIAERWQTWVAMAHVLDAAALEAIRAIDAHDVDKLSDVGGTIDEACESCHLVFWYPETN